MSNTTLNMVSFEFETPENKRLYTLKWFPVASEYYSASGHTEKWKPKFEVAIYRGGGYKCSVYTQHRASITESKTILEKFLNSNP